ERAGYAPILELPYLQLRSVRSSDADPLRGMARRPRTGQRVKPGTQDSRRHLGFPQRDKAAPNAKGGQKPTIRGRMPLAGTATNTRRPAKGDLTDELSRGEMSGSSMQGACQLWLGAEAKLICHDPFCGYC